MVTIALRKRAATKFALGEKLPIVLPITQLGPVSDASDMAMTATEYSRRRRSRAPGVSR